MKNSLNWAMNQRFAQTSDAPMTISTEDGEGKKQESFVQWTTPDDRVFMPANKNVKLLKPGFYEIGSSMQGIYFEKVALATEDLIKFPETESETVVAEIEKFWQEEEKFRKNKLAYKRGILLYGPPGSGKSCTIRMVLDNIVRHGGIVLKFDNAGVFKAGMRTVRMIQPETPVIALMEDLDSILNYNCESEVINILDGINGVDKVVYLATTNYPEKLGSRIMNRPSRFDRRYYIGMPNAESRRIYLQHKLKDKDHNVEKWVEDTEGMSIAHLKELVVAVTILDNDYDDAVEILREMKNKVNSKAWDELGDGQKLASAIRNKKTNTAANWEIRMERLDAFRAGRRAFLAGKPLSDNPGGRFAESWEAGWAKAGGSKSEKKDGPESEEIGKMAKSGPPKEQQEEAYETLEERGGGHGFAECVERFKNDPDIDDVEKFCGWLKTRGGGYDSDKKAAAFNSVEKRASGWNSPFFPGRFFQTKTAILKVLAEKDDWPTDLKEGRFTEWCKRNGFDGPCKACADKAFESDDASVRGMASFYVNTVKP